MIRSVLITLTTAAAVIVVAVVFRIVDDAAQIRVARTRARFAAVHQTQTGCGTAKLFASFGQRTHSLGQHLVQPGAQVNLMMVMLLHCR